MPEACFSLQRYESSEFETLFGLQSYMKAYVTALCGKHAALLSGGARLSYIREQAGQQPCMDIVRREGGKKVHTASKAASKWSYEIRIFQSFLTGTSDSSSNPYEDRENDSSTLVDLGLSRSKSFVRVLKIVKDPHRELLPRLHIPAPKSQPVSHSVP
ncbi:hypothetical protein MMC17_005069 [Xylographa soralifera]|nr:hypothetical protein [Xylographa soralifera]